MTFFAVGNEFDSPGQEAAFSDLLWAEADVLQNARPQLGLFAGPNVIPEWNFTRNKITLGRTEPLTNGWTWTTPDLVF